MSADPSNADDSTMIEREVLSDADDFPMLEREDLFDADDSPKVEEDPTSPEDFAYICEPQDYSMCIDPVCYGPQTCLYWNLSHYPIPANANVVSMHRNIKLALHLMGIHGSLEINVYGGKLSQGKSDLSEANIYHMPSKGAGMSIAGQMCVDMLLYAESSFGLERTSFVVLAEQNREFDELKRVLGILQLKYQFAALIVDPTTQQDGDLFQSAESVLKSTEFVHGGKTRPRIPDFKIIRPIEKVETCLFWDTTDCPWPVGWSADAIFHKIKSLLTEMYCVVGRISVVAYVDEDKKDSWVGFLSNKMQESRIRIAFHQGGHKAARHQRMLHDLLLWSIYHAHGSYLVVVSGKVKKEFFDTLTNLEAWKGYRVSLITPPEDESHDKEWPRMLFDNGHDFGPEAVPVAEAEAETVTVTEGPKFKKYKPSH